MHLAFNQAKFPMPLLLAGWTGLLFDIRITSQNVHRTMWINIKEYCIIGIFIFIKGRLIRSFTIHLHLSLERLTDWHPLHVKSNLCRMCFGNLCHAIMDVSSIELIHVSKLMEITAGFKQGHTIKVLSHFWMSTKDSHKVTGKLPNPALMLGSL